MYTRSCLLALSVFLVLASGCDGGSGSKDAGQIPVAPLDAAGGVADGALTADAQQAPADVPLPSVDTAAPRADTAPTSADAARPPLDAGNPATATTTNTASSTVTGSSTATSTGSSTVTASTTATATNTGATGTATATATNTGATGTATATATNTGATGTATGTGTGTCNYPACATDLFSDCVPDACAGPCVEQQTILCGATACSDPPTTVPTAMTSNTCYANGVKVLTTIDMSNLTNMTAVTVVKKNGAVCYSYEMPYSSASSEGVTMILKNASGETVGTYVINSTARTATITCAGGAPVVVSLDCVWSTSEGGSTCPACTEGTCTP